MPDFIQFGQAVQEIKATSGLTGNDVTVHSDTTMLKRTLKNPHISNFIQFRQAVQEKKLLPVNRK